MGTLRDVPRKVAQEEAGNYEGANRSIAALPLALCLVAFGANDSGASRALFKVDALAPCAVGQKRSQVAHVAIVPGIEHDGSHAAGLEQRTPRSDGQPIEEHGIGLAVHPPCCVQGGGGHT
jgi:hypothetical protein